MDSFAAVLTRLGSSSMYEIMCFKGTNCILTSNDYEDFVSSYITYSIFYLQVKNKP